MSDLSTINRILDFAIKNEQDAVALYSRLAKKTQSPSARIAFEQFAEEERGHEAKLKNVKSGQKLLNAEEIVQDLQISDYTVQTKLEANPSYQSILLFAMQQEKAAFRLYWDLASYIGDTQMKDLFLGLAKEEAKHKLKFEIEYDDEILKEN